MKLEALTKDARGRGLAVDGIATVKYVEFHGQNTAEVIFTAAEVEVTPEMRVRVPDGIGDGTVRTVSENAKTLKFPDVGVREGVRMATTGELRAGAI